MNPVSTASSSPFMLPACPVVLADDHALIRAAFRCLLEGSGAATVVAEAQDGEEALEKITACAPAVALVDLAMPKLNGVEVARRAKAAGSTTRIVIVTGLDGLGHARESLAAGACGFVPKSAAATDLVAAVRAVATGEPYVHASVVADLVRAECGAEAIDRSGELSERESWALRLIARGYSNKEIATDMAVSVKTVETYKARGMKKIAATSRADLVRYAIERGWLI